MKIKFFHLMSLKNGGGCENNFIRMASAMVGAVDEVCIVSASEAFHSRLVFLLGVFYGNIFRSQKSKIFRFSDEEIVLRLGRAVWKKVKLLKLRPELNTADLIYSKNELLDLFCLKLLCVRRPVVVGMHTNVHYPVARTFHEKLHNWLYQSLFYRWLISGREYFRVLNQEDKEFLIDKHRISAEQIEIIGNGVDVDHFSKFTGTDEVFRILFVGRLAPQKGIMDVAEIIDELNRQGFADKISFTVVGDGALKAEFLEKINGAGNVEVLAQVPYEEMPELYQKADICLVPSYWETFNSVVLEAQSCGLPVISYDIPGPREMINHNETGYLIPRGEIADAISKIVELHELKKNDRVSFNKICRSARGNIVAKFSHDQVFLRLKELIFKGGNKCVDS